MSKPVCYLEELFMLKTRHEIQENLILTYIYKVATSAIRVFR